jgi:hypothetical protein
MKKPIYFDMLNAIPPPPRHFRRMHRHKLTDIQIRALWGQELGLVTHGELDRAWSLALEEARRRLPTSDPPV